MATPFDTFTRGYGGEVIYDRDRRDSYERAMDAGSPRGGGPRPASEAARNFLRDLMIEKAVAGGHNADEVQANVVAYTHKPTRTAREVSKEIDRLKAEGFTGRKARTATTGPRGDYPTAEQVPAGRYCIPTLSADAINELAFYQVDRPEEGKWAGYVFVKRMVGGNPNIAVKGQAARTVLAEIAKDAREASIRYGRESEECGVCHTNLTNDDSRKYGIGPKCRVKMGW